MVLVRYLRVFLKTSEVLPTKEYKSTRSFVCDCGYLSRQRSVGCETCFDCCCQFVRRQVWIPLTWRRSNMVFSSYVVGLFGLFILEFSLWNNFGNYIWYVSIGFTILDMVIGDIVSYQLKEVSGICILIVTVTKTAQTICTWGGAYAGKVFGACFLRGQWDETLSKFYAQSSLQRQQQQGRQNFHFQVILFVWNALCSKSYL